VTDREVPDMRQEKIHNQDAALAQDLRAGHPDAARDLFDRFGAKLLAFIAARFPTDIDFAQDLVIQTLADATRKIRWYNPRKAPLVVWLYGVARGQIRAELRRRGRRKSVPPHALSSIEELEGTPDVHDLAEDVAERVSAQRQVALLSSILSELELDILVLRSVDQLSAREIGLIVGRSERAVHSILHRARTKARERLEQDA